MIPAVANASNMWAVQRLLHRAALLHAESSQSAPFIRAARHIMAMDEPLTAHTHGDSHAAKVSALREIPGVGKSIARQLLGDPNSAVSAPVLHESPNPPMTFNEASEHVLLLREWLPHLNPRLTVHATGAFRRGCISVRPLHVLVSDVDSRVAEPPNPVQLEKIVQFLRHKRYLLAASPAPSAHLGVTARLASQNATPGLTSVVSIHLVPFDVLFAALLITTGPSSFVAKAHAAAQALQVRLSVERGVTVATSGKRQSDTKMVKSEVDLFRLIDIPYVHPVDRV